ncbi:hypothetical protein L8C07_05660 [Paenibacillus sp. CMAA1739]|uniref:hypothetical protein n=1 Tax=Paenibacillus ottowii TaxID=2315729 RepID=UPI002DBB5A30|nr:hypothetical protein [Paenibacillus sp. CMAA1739]MEC4565425.1 hypothetical protein [Paenibacillus sp. CMAA1739]
MQHEELVEALQIPKKAEIVINLMSFLLRSNDDRSEMFCYCCKQKGLELEFLGKKRRALIDQYGYKNKEEFVTDYLEDKVRALEKLCQEKVEERILVKFKTNSPDKIYNAYSKNGKYTAMIRLAYLA